MRTGRFIVGLLVMGFVAASQVIAAPKLNEGTRQLGVSGELSDVEGGFATSLSGSGGYFLMDNVEVGVKADLSYRSSDEREVENTMMLLNVGAFGEYNFIVPNLPIVPYAGAGAGIGYWSSEFKSHGVSEDDSKFVIVLAGWGGAKFFVVDSLAIGCQFEVDLATDDIYDEGDSMDWKFVLRTDYYF